MGAVSFNRPHPEYVYRYTKPNGTTIIKLTIYINPIWAGLLMGKNGRGRIPESGFRNRSFDWL